MSTDVITMLGGLVIGIAAMLIARRALFADKPNGRQRCPKCWYDLTHSPTMTCGECGHTVKKEKHLYRVRRRMRLGILCIMCASIAGWAVIDRVREVGVMTVVPTGVLIVAMPITEADDGVIYRELIERVASNDLSPEQWLALAEKCAEGDRAARPVTPEWRGKYAPLLRHIARWCYDMRRNQQMKGVVPVETVLYDIRPVPRIETRETWPSDAPVCLEVNVSQFWPGETQVRVHATPRIAGAETTVFCRTGQGRPRHGYPVMLPPLDPDVKEVTVDLKYDRRTIGRDKTWMPVGEDSITVPVRIADGAEGALMPVTSESMDRAIRRVFQNMVRWPSGDLPVRISVDHRPTRRDEFEGVAIGVRFEVLYMGKVGRQLNMWWMAGRDVDDPDYGYEVPVHDDALMLAATWDPALWSIRVTSVPELALRVEGAKSYWEGAFTIEQPRMVQNQKAPHPPDRPWWPADEDDWVDLTPGGERVD